MGQLFPLHPVLAAWSPRGGTPHDKPPDPGKAAYSTVTEQGARGPRASPQPEGHQGQMGSEEVETMAPVNAAARGVVSRAPVSMCEAPTLTS